MASPRATRENLAAWDRSVRPPVTTPTSSNSSSSTATTDVSKSSLSFILDAAACEDEVARGDVVVSLDVNMGKPPVRRVGCRREDVHPHETGKWNKQQQQDDDETEMKGQARGSSDVAFAGGVDPAQQHQELSSSGSSSNPRPVLVKSKQRARPHLAGIAMRSHSAPSEVVVMHRTQRKRKPRRRPPSRICKHEGCEQYVVDQGLCVRHGGGKRCETEGCTSRAKHDGKCWKHGGSTGCKVAGCVNRAKSRGYCWSHGGGTKCTAPACCKIAISNGLCWAHGGGKRCVVDGCQRQAYERTMHYCNTHYRELVLESAESDDDSETNAHSA